MSARAVVNPAELELKPLSHGDRFAVEIGEVAEALGLTRLGCMLHVVQPGKIAFPYHRHHENDEIFIILSGSGEYRIGDRRLPVKAGDCLGAAAGGKAHQIINTGHEPLRYLGLSNNVTAEVVEYPDSGKIGIRAGIRNYDFNSATFKGRGRLTAADYWDGE
jgi:uncharacterized cupin superfamily protein